MFRSIKFEQHLNSFISYRNPASTRIGHVYLKLSDLERSLKFYCDLPGFELQQYYGDSAAFISAGGYHHHIGLNTWHRKNAGSAPANTSGPGLYHTAVLYLTRKELAKAVKRLIDASYSLTGSLYHCVSEAIYLDDSGRNGVELY